MHYDHVRLGFDEQFRSDEVGVLDLGYSTSYSYKAGEKTASVVRECSGDLAVYLFIYVCVRYRIKGLPANTAPGE